jgi:16S rRNA (uracil1498-N3)-methyltransferase
MSLPYFFEPVIDTHTNTLVLSEETSKHAIQVLRMKAGECLQLTDGKGALVKATVLDADKKHCMVQVNDGNFIQAPVRKTALAVSLVKNAARFEWLLEKATEIGITEIIPLICKRTEMQRFKIERMQTILVSAMLQSRQCWLPVLQAPVDYATLIQSNATAYTQKFIAHCEEGRKQKLVQYNMGKNMIILIGPEGDFTEDEIELALQSNFVPVSLGDTRLRSETAAIVAATLLVNLA